MLERAVHRAGALEGGVAGGEEPAAGLVELVVGELGELGGGVVAELAEERGPGGNLF